MSEEFPTGLVDTHCHLNFEQFDNDRELVVERARAQGLSHILIPGIDFDTSQSAIRLAHTYAEIFASIGLHPNEGALWTNDSIPELKQLAKDEKVVAIGEIGLDYYRNRTSRETQRYIFKQQLDLAAELDLPVIIHNREASDDLYKILQEWISSLQKSRLELSRRPGVLHSFSGDSNFVRNVISLNFKIGITGPITFHNSKILQEVVNIIGLEDIVIETDAPFLTPHPFRGKRNEPANVRIVAEKIADLKSISLDKVAEITTANAQKLFKWSVPL